MLMLNLIKLQHALGASIPNCVIYSKYTVEYMICTNSHHVPCFVFTFFLQLYRGFFVCFFNIELAVKQVQFEHVNTGSFIFSGCGGESKGVEVKIYENKTVFCFVLFF